MLAYFVKQNEFFSSLIYHTHSDTINRILCVINEQRNAEEKVKNLTLVSGSKFFEVIKFVTTGDMMKK